MAHKNSRRSDITIPPQWEQRKIPVNEIDLDQKNSRLLNREKLSQKEIIEKLIAQEGVLELARSIIANGGLYQHEDIIVVKTNKRFVVVEGNRRCAAIKIILNPELLPAKQRGRLSQATESLKHTILFLNSRIAPSLADAAPLISALHTKNSKKAWSAAAKAFHIGRLADQGLKPDEIAKIERMEPGSIKKALLNHRLLGIASSASDLTSSESEKLQNPRLKVSPFTRVFGLKWMGLRFPIKLGDNGKLVHEGFDEDEARKIIQYMSRNFLLPAEGGKPRFDTRTPEQTILGEIESRHSDLHKSLNKRIKNSSKPLVGKTNTISMPLAKTTPHKSTPNHDYFQGLNPGKLKNNDALVQAVIELSTIDIGRFPSSALFLQRTVAEGCLVHVLKEKRLWASYMALQNNGKYGLDSLLAFCKDNAVGIWRNPSDFRQHLGDWSRSKFLADKAAHALIQGNPAHAKEAAVHIRPIIEGILREDY